MWVSPPPCYPVPLRPKYSPHHPILKHSQPTFHSQYELPGFTPIAICTTATKNVLLG
jgi:hypothetical protein